METQASTSISIKGGELYILTSETKELPKEVHIDSKQILPLIYGDHTFTFDNSYDEKLYKLKWVFEAFREEIKLIKFIKSSKFQFYRYFTTVLKPGTASIDIPQNNRDFRISPSGGSGNMDNKMAFMSVKPQSILDWRPTELIVPHENYQQFDTLGPNVLKFNTNFPFNIKNDSESTTQIYYISKTTLKTDTHYNNTIGILKSGYISQTSYFETQNETNYYFSFLKVFSIAVPHSVVFLNSGVSYQSDDLPIIFDKLIFDMINHFSIEKNLTVIISAGNQIIDLNTFISKNSVFDFLNTPTKAIVVGAIISDVEFDSNHGAIVDCYARTPINGFGKSSAASAKIARLVADLMDYAKSAKGVNLSPQEIKDLIKKTNTNNRINIPELGVLKSSLDSF